MPYLTDVQHRVRARDLVGNLSDFAEGPTIRLRRYSEGTSAATYSSGWTASSNSSALGGGLRYATKSGASVTFRFTGRAVAWISRTSSSLGNARVYIDGTSVGVYGLGGRAATDMWSSRGRSLRGAHTMQIVVLGIVRPAAYRRRRVPRHAVTDPLLPPATIGILGGGQLGRMLGFAARAMGYRIVVLDPDPECPAAAVADRVVVGAYDDADAALELAADADVVTYELEHVALDVVRAIIERTPVRPGIEPLRVTQDRLAERRFVERAGIAVAPWRAVATTEALASAASDLGTPLRLKAPTGGYDGRSQVRVAGAADIESAIGRFGRPEGAPLLAERELDFEAELSVIVARGMDGKPAIFPPARNLHDAGILVESVTPADLPAAALREATAIALNLAAAMDLVGTLTVELFLLRDGSLVVNELAPRVHNSGHWTIEGAATSQFEQHVRAICGLPLGATNARGPTAIVNVLGTGPEREARLLGVDEALAVPGTPPPPLRQATGLRAAQDGPRDGSRSDPAGGPRPRPGRAFVPALGGRARDRAARRRGRWEPLGLPGARGRRHGPRRARRSVGAAGCLGPSDPGPPLPLRGDGRGARASG